MTAPRIDIISNGGMAQVFVDGNQISHVKNYDIMQEPGSLPTVKLELMPGNIVIHESTSESPVVAGTKEVTHSEPSDSMITVSLTDEQMIRAIDYAVSKSRNVFNDELQKRWDKIDEKVNDRTDNHITNRQFIAGITIVGTFIGIVSGAVLALLNYLF